MEEITQERYEDLADMLLQRAKGIRAQYRYSEDEKMAQCAGLVGMNPEVLSVMIPLRWKDDDEKQKMMLALCMTAKAVDARAVFLIADARWVCSTPFSEHFNIPPFNGTEDHGAKEFQRRYMEVLKRYDYQIKNLPRKLWTEAVTVVLKGPGITPIMRLASYVEGRRDTVEWLPVLPLEGDHTRVEINMLPDWWTVQ